MTHKEEPAVQDQLHADQELLRDQQEANAQMVRATIRAQEATDEAEAGKERAEQDARELRELAEFRELFIGILGHDLRNPLGAIDTAADVLLRRGNLDSQAVWAVTRIIKSSRRMTRMIDQLTDLTRVRLGGGLALVTSPTNLREVCQGIVEEFGAPVQLEIEGDVKGSWDADRLAAVLSNVIGNAIDHAAPGTAVVVKVHVDGRDVVVEISNQGEPIPAEVLPFIFEPFRRARSSGKSPAGHLGLGLYIAHEIVLAHGGTLDAHSSTGTTSFVMRLPRDPPFPRSR